MRTPPPYSAAATIRVSGGGGNEIPREIVLQKKGTYHVASITTMVSSHDSEGLCWGGTGGGEGKKIAKENRWTHNIG